MAYTIEIAGKPYNVEFLLHTGGAKLWINGKAYDALLKRKKDGDCELIINDRILPVRAGQKGDTSFVHILEQAWEVRISENSNQGTPDTENNFGGIIVAPMPGMTIDIKVSTGQAVTAGQPLLVIESMKMQTEILASQNGIVVDIPVGKGQNFERGALLIRLEQEDKKCAA